MSHLHGTDYDDASTSSATNHVADPLKRQRIYARADELRRRRLNKRDDLDMEPWVQVAQPNTPAEDELGESLRDCVIIPANSTPQATADLLYRQGKDTAWWKKFKLLVWGLK